MTPQEPGVAGATSRAIGIIFSSAIDAIGITPIIVGTVRKSQLKNTPNYDNLRTGSLNLSPAIGVNQINKNPYFGMSLSLNF